MERNQDGLKGPYVPSPSILSQFNTQNLPSKRELYNICKKAEETHEKQLLGTFYISTGLYKSRKATVYVAISVETKCLTTIKLRKYCHKRTTKG